MLVSKPPRYSEVMNCCVIAVFPQPAIPMTRTLAWGLEGPGLGFTLSLETELDVRDVGDKGQKSPSDDMMLLVLLDRNESLR